MLQYLGLEYLDPLGNTYLKPGVNIYLPLGMNYIPWTTGVMFASHSGSMLHVGGGEGEQVSSREGQEICTSSVTRSSCRCAVIGLVRRTIQY